MFAIATNRRSAAGHDELKMGQNVPFSVVSETFRCRMRILLSGGEAADTTKQKSEMQVKVCRRMMPFPSK